MKQNGYQIICETLVLSETKFKEMIRSGELSDPKEINRIKDLSDTQQVTPEIKSVRGKHVPNAGRSNIIPTERQYLKGIVRGTKNINKKNDSTIVHAADIRGPMTIPHPVGLGPIINLPYKHIDTLIDPNLIDMKNPLTRAFANRHESDEATVLNNKMKKDPGGHLSPAGSDKLKGKTYRSLLGIPIGQHHDGVLDAEKKNVNFANSIYDKAKDLKKYRQISGEYNPIRNRGNSVPLLIGSVKQGAKIFGKKLLQRFKR